MRYSVIILVALALLLTGCVTTELRVENKTGTGIYLYSGHTKDLTTIPAGATATVPHTSGQIIVITKQDNVWDYNDIDALVAGATKSYKRVSLHVTIERDGSILLPSGTILIPTRKLTIEKSMIYHATTSQAL